MEKNTKLIAGCMLVLAFEGLGGVLFNMPKEIPAVPGVLCNVYFERAFASVKPSNYAFEALSEAGNFWADCWTWTPTEKDAGRRVRLILNAWSDSGLVTAATSTVVVVGAPEEALKSRPLTVALFSASATNCRFQDQLRTRMREAGFANYKAIGSHSGGSSSFVCEPEKDAPHDGYGGFAWGDFLHRYALTVEEIDNMQAEAEKEQLKMFGVKLKPGDEWRKALLKSPIVCIRNGQKVVDVQAWLDTVNGGQAPDFLFITLGGNGIATTPVEKIAAAIENQLGEARKLVAILRKAMPATKIVITSAFGGSTLQDGWGKNYGAKISAFRGNLNRIDYDLAVEELVAGLRDDHVLFAPVSFNLDPVGGFPHGKHANALHATLKGGQMFGDGLYMWLRNYLATQKK